MGQDEVNDDEAMIDVALRMLGQGPARRGPGVERLAGGLSGSMVWRIELDGRSLVLKVTPASSEPVMLERAHRELAFYRDLANRIPLLVPELVGQAMDERGAVLLLAAAVSAPPLAAWPECDFQQVAHDLGRLHGRFWGRTGDVGLPGWLREMTGVSVEQAVAVQGLWAEVDLPPGLGRHRDVMAHLARQAPLLDRRFAALPPTLCHGDAHRDNLLRAGTGEWIWADWQEVRLGQGVDDLAFFWQRAYTITEAIPDPEDLVDAYRKGLVLEGAPLVAREILVRALGWAELRMWAIDWPPYLGWLSPTVIGRVLRRTTVLTARLGIDVR